MPPIREHRYDYNYAYDQEMLFEEDDGAFTRSAQDVDVDSDGMPSLVERPEDDMPTPLETSSYTIFSNMAPITFDTTHSTQEPVTFNDAPSTSASDTPRRASHSKKRDPSYIPRPPNAFILFRSSFIRSQQVPEKVEGNHSTLSKIIGRYWKTLPKEEREKWEAKAVVAQAEHRRRYPDWRFRPGMQSQLKTKDGTGTGSGRGKGKGKKKEDV